MKRVAVFPGSFDPITLGHVSVIERAVPLFDEIIVAIGRNSQKKYMYSLEQRLDWIQEVFKNSPKVRVESYEGLTVNYCIEKEAKFLLRGLRNQQDFEFEKSIAFMNKGMVEDIETVFLLTDPKYSAINSSIVRDIIRNGGDATKFLPPNMTL